MLTWHRFIASAGNLVHQANSKQRIIDKMEAACFIEKIEYQKPLRFNFEDIRKLPPPIIAFDNMRFRIRGIRILYEKLSFGIQYVLLLSSSLLSALFSVFCYQRPFSSPSQPIIPALSLFISLLYTPIFLRRPHLLTLSNCPPRHHNVLPSSLPSYSFTLFHS
jgi:hypothetical protein